MKKLFTLLGLIGILVMSTPVFAAPMGAAPGGHRGQMVHAGPGMARPPQGGGHHMSPPPPPPAHSYYRGSAVIGGVLARRSYWGYRNCYYNRLAYCNDYYYRPIPAYYGSGVYVNLGIPIRF